MTTDELKALVRDVPDFPQEGIVFKDLMPLIGNAEAFHSTVQHLAEWSRPRQPDVILGAEARGFIFGGALAYVYCDGASLSTLNFNTFSQVAFDFRVTRGLLAQGLTWALVIGMAGGLLPAIRAARLPVTEALRTG